MGCSRDTEKSGPAGCDTGIGRRASICGERWPVEDSLDHCTSLWGGETCFKCASKADEENVLKSNQQCVDGGRQRDFG